MGRPEDMRPGKWLNDNKLLVQHSSSVLCERVNRCIDLVIVAVSLGLFWYGHRAMNVGLVAVLDVLSKWKSWRQFFIVAALLPNILMMQAFKSVRFHLYLALMAALMSWKMWTMPLELISTVLERSPEPHQLASLIWSWILGFSLLEWLKLFGHPDDALSLLLLLLTFLTCLQAYLHLRHWPKR